MNQVLAKIAAILGNMDKLVELANVCFKAYCEQAREKYELFGAEKPELVAQNMAALPAVLNAAQLMAFCAGNLTPDEIAKFLLDVLTNIRDGNITTYDVQLLGMFANATWAAQQPMRTDKGPLGRATRMNIFCLLPKSEVDKDIAQVRATAGWLLEQIS